MTRATSSDKRNQTRTAHPKQRRTQYARYHGILALGMHRSGTSALTRTLGMMGAYVGEPEELLPAHAEDNPTGYWERKELNGMHDRFLQANGFAWDRVANFQPGTYQDDSALDLANDIESLITRLSARSPTWLIKDPRLCLLLPHWQAQLDHPVYVVSVRDPREIAASMFMGPRGAFTSPFVIALWEKYTRTMLDCLAGHRALFVSYADLLVNPQAQCARLLHSLRRVGCKGLDIPSTDELNAFLDTKLRRSVAKPHIQLSPSQAALFDWLLQRCAVRGSVKVTALPKPSDNADVLLAEFEQTFDYRGELGRQRAVNETVQKLTAIETALQQNVQLSQQWQGELAASQRENLAQLARADAANKALAEQKVDFDNLQSTLSSTRQELEAVRAGLAEQQSLTGKAQAELAMQERLAEHFKTELETERQRSESLRTQLVSEQDSSRQLSLQLADKTAAAERAQIALAANAALLERAQSEQDALRKEIDRVLHLNHVHLGNTHELRGTVDFQLTELERLIRHTNALEEGMRDLRSSWSWRITAPVRGFAALFKLRPSAQFEQKLYRWYYAIPGISASRKRGWILWLHRNFPWLTRKTLSHKIYALSKDATAATGANDRSKETSPRTNEQHAAELIGQMKQCPLISILMPVYNVEARWLNRAVDSVRRQFYPYWELCIVDDASTYQETRQALEVIARSDSRIKLKRLRKNLGIGGASNAALRLSSGEYVGLLDNDDELTRDALLEVALCINESDPDVIYSDEDKLEVDGTHSEPHFKPDFNIDYFMSINYLCHFTVLRRKLFKRIGGFRKGFEGAQDYDLLLRATEHGEKVEHIRKILYHWRKISGSTAASTDAKPESWEAGQRALTESLGNRHIDATAELGPYPNTFRVRRTIKDQPLVSILLPFRDEPELLRTCVGSILEKTDYARFEIIGIDNGSVQGATHQLMHELDRRDSRIRFIRHDVPFNYSAINNFAAKQARGEHLLFLNNDTEVIAPEWLRAMLEHSQRPEVGVVGAKLLYPDKCIQHAGVIIGIGGVAGHAHLNEPADHPGYFARAQLQQNLSAVTFACAMTRRAVFDEVGGLNQDDLKIAFNDIDFCLRVRESGYLIVYSPIAELYHHESRSRGYEDNPEKQARFSEEVRYMQRRHGEILRQGDPHYNPNLRLDTHDFSPVPGYVDALPI